MSVQSEITRLQTIKSEIKTAIEAKGQVVGDIPFAQYANKIQAIETGSGGGDQPSYEKNFNGTVDTEGLTAIGWDAEDIAALQRNVWWDIEDNSEWVVSQYEKDTYGVINYSNKNTYKGMLRFMPKFDTAGLSSLADMFRDWNNLYAIPIFDTSSCTNAQSLLMNCLDLKYIPNLNLANASTNYVAYGATSLLVSESTTLGSGGGSRMFTNTTSLLYLANKNIKCSYELRSMFENSGYESYLKVDCNNVESGYIAFSGARSIRKITLTNSSSMNNVSQCFVNMDKLEYIKMDATSMPAQYFTNCPSLSNIYITNLSNSIDLSSSKAVLTKKSLLHTINNSICVSDSTIKVNARSYAILSIDTDVIAALSAKPNLSLIS